MENHLEREEVQEALHSGAGQALRDSATTGEPQLYVAISDGSKVLRLSQTFDQIRALAENGIRFVAASGRQYPNLRRLFAPVQDDISYIAENGSLCIHEGKTLSRGLIPRELGNRIVDAIHHCSGCGGL